MSPVFVENSIIPKVLSFIAPIEIGAIAIFPFVFCRGNITDIIRVHETIHFQQQLETAIIVFYIIYMYDFIKNKFKGLPSRDAYLQLRAEKEAYENQNNMNYLSNRKRWQWLGG